LPAEPFSIIEICLIVICDDASANTIQQLSYAWHHQDPPKYRWLAPTVRSLRLARYSLSIPEPLKLVGGEST
jgi:hypothetical protein